jgi:hypothetical protein
MLEYMRRKDFDDSYTELITLLHDKGYTYFTIPKLTWPEIQRLIDGEKLRQERNKAK